jgi:UDP-N-acetylglucosamine 2-epimerase (non-hydrolysing)
MRKSNSLLFLAGTSAEAIKLSPIIRRLKHEKMNYSFIWTGQHVNLVDQSFDHDFLPVSGRFITNGWRQKNPVNFLQFSLWYLWMNLSLFCYLLLNRPQILVVHGDTLSALAGSYIGRFLRIQVAHVEAGYRNIKRWTPFPEEITRRLISRFANLHFAPGQEMVQNLLAQGISKENVFNTFDNTAIDNLYDLKIESKSEGYGVVTLHRTEFLTNRKLLSRTFFALNSQGRKKSIYVVADHRLLKALERLPLESLSNLKILPKMRYIDFIRYVAKADFVITDSGGLRQEMEYLGKPLIIHRTEIEYQKQEKSSLRLTNLSIQEMTKLIEHHEELSTKVDSDFVSPSAEIIKTLKLILK